jgi:iron complex outermembrane receptor protein
VWGARFSNYIFGNLTGRTCDDAGNCVVGDTGELKELIYEQLDSKFWGAEAKSTFGLYTGPSGKLQALLLADYVRATLDNGGNVPRIPPYHIGGGLAWEGANLDASFLVKYSGAQNDVGTAETPTDGFTSVDAQLGWRPWTSTPGLELALVGHNLTDSVQRNSVALNKDEVILPGRDVSLILRANF